MTPEDVVPAGCPSSGRHVVRDRCGVSHAERIEAVDGENVDGRFGGKRVVTATGRER
ncbi:hypothetical protein [Natronococcus occultus]|uniref:hypothetical protein n=1 Tax=Natronococcus occultus TaxID=29288 RepID=UPI0012F88031|nr:hypothetical protein [Natronococcus occultus]